MKRIRRSQVPLFLGLALGLMALWVTASPVGASGDLITGSWTACWVQGTKIASTESYCPGCAGTYLGYCSDGLGCFGGNIVVLIANASGGTPYRTGTSPVCYGLLWPWHCRDVYNAGCY
jgi:hypothetical protein